MVDIPNRTEITDNTKSGVAGGVPVALGQTVGRSVLGAGIGTAVGGIIGSSMIDNETDSRILAEVTVMNATNELMAGGMASSSGGSNNQVM